MYAAFPMPMCAVKMIFVGEGYLGMVLKRATNPAQKTYGILVLPPPLVCKGECLLYIQESTQQIKDVQECSAC